MSFGGQPLTADILSYAELDSRRFGKRIYRARVLDEFAAQALATLDASHDAELIIARVPAHRLEAVQILERRGFVLADTLLYYVGPTAPFAEARPPPRLRLRESKPADRTALETLARSSFASFEGHYHADSRLDSSAATEGYIEWCLALEAATDKTVMIAECEDEIAGFLAYTRLSDGRGEQLLGAVAREHRKRGVFAALVTGVARSLWQAGAVEVLGSTVVTNLAVRRVYVRNHMMPCETWYTLHGWL